MNEDEYRQKSDIALALVPDEFRAQFSWMAYERGHAYGYNEVYNELMDLIDNLLPCIEKYGKCMHDKGWEGARNCFYVRD